MKHSSNVFVILLILGLVTMCCAGCISLSPATSEIHVGNQSVGTITVSPTEDLFSLDTSAERININLDLLDSKDFINNLTNAEKTKLLRLITGNESIDLSMFINNASEDDKTQNEEQDLWIQIMNIKLSSENDKTISDSLKSPNLEEELDETMNALNKLLDELKIT